ncbi:hypothetical protein Tco_1207399 [Tanacetum coccineum]
MTTDPHHTPNIIQPSTSQPQKKQRSRRLKRKDIGVPKPSGPTTNVANEAVNEEMDDSLVRAATTASSLEVEQNSGGGPRCQETMGDIIAQTRIENVSKLSNDPLLARVIDLENTKTAQDQEITSLKLRVKKLEKKGGSRTHKLKRLYKVGRSARIVSSDEASLGDQEDASKQGRKIDDIDKDVEITLVDETQGRYDDDIMFDVSDLAGKELFVTKQGVPDSKKDDVVQVNTAATTIKLKSAKPKTATSTRPKAKGLVIHEQEEAPTLIVSSQQASQAKIQDKAEFDEQERIEREKAKVNLALKETWDDIQAKIEADQLLAERLQAREQEELTIKERAILFQQLLEKRREHFAAKRAEEKRNRPPTKAQQRRDELEQESIKKQKVDKDKETAELKSLMEVIPDENFDREDLKTLYKLVKAKYGSTRPVEDLDIVLYQDLKTMFDLHVEDQERIVMIKRLLDDFEVTAAKVCVTAIEEG